jgi:hypothetical protein
MRVDPAVSVMASPNTPPDKPAGDGSAGNANGPDMPKLRAGGLGAMLVIQEFALPDVHREAHSSVNEVAEQSRIARRLSPLWSRTEGNAAIVRRQRLVATKLAR